MKANITRFLKLWLLWGCIELIADAIFVTPFASDFITAFWEASSLDSIYASPLDAAVVLLVTKAVILGGILALVHTTCRAIWRKMKSRFTAFMLCTAIFLGLLPWFFPNPLARDELSQIQADIGHSLIAIALCLLILGIGRFGIWVWHKLSPAPS